MRASSPSTSPRSPSSRCSPAMRPQLGVSRLCRSIRAQRSAAATAFVPEWLKIAGALVLIALLAASIRRTHVPGEWIWLRDRLAALTGLRVSAARLALGEPRGRGGAVPGQRAVHGAAGRGRPGHAIRADRRAGARARAALPPAVAVRLSPRHPQGPGAAHRVQPGSAPAGGGGRDPAKPDRLGSGPWRSGGREHLVPEGSDPRRAVPADRRRAAHRLALGRPVPHRGCGRVRVQRRRAGCLRAQREPGGAAQRGRSHRHRRGVYLPAHRGRGAGRGGDPGQPGHRSRRHPGVVLPSALRARAERGARRVPRCRQRPGGQAAHDQSRPYVRRRDRRVRRRARRPR